MCYVYLLSVYYHIYVVILSLFIDVPKCFCLTVTYFVCCFVKCSVYSLLGIGPYNTSGVARFVLLPRFCIFSLFIYHQPIIVQGFCALTQFL